MSIKFLTRFAWGTLALNILVIVWGAFVRATGSGAGCGSHWPTCNGQVIPRDPSVQTLIEYSHRASSGLALLAVFGLVFMVHRAFPAGHAARRAAIASVVLILTEAALGAGLVIFGLVENDDSIARAFSIALHLGNTFLLLAALSLTAFWIGGGQTPAGKSIGGKAGRLFWASIAVTILIGVSGAIAALGDTLFPSTSLAEGFAADLSPTSHLFVKLRTFHPFVAVAGSGLLLMLVSAVRREKRAQPARKLATALNFMVFIQLAAGGINILLLAPVWMQLVHLLLADFLWIALVLTGAALAADPRR